MRFINTKGDVLECNRIYTFAETTAMMNGERKNYFEKAKSMEFATGIVLKRDDMNVFCGQPDFVVGNLPNGKAQEIIRTLTEQGYYDFSKQGYQNARDMSKVVISADAKPYCSDQTFMDMGVLSAITNAFGVSPFMSTPVGNSVFGLEDDEPSEDSECGEEGEEC